MEDHIHRSAKRQSHGATKGKNQLEPGGVVAEPPLPPAANDRALRAEEGSVTKEPAQAFF
jgi:hypothetical protein